MRGWGMVVVLAAGCAGNRIRGDVNGEPARISDAVYVQNEDHFGDGDDLVRIVAAEVTGDLCELLTELDDLAADADADALEDFWAEQMPEEFWWLVLDLRIEDLDEDLTEIPLEGVEWGEGHQEEGEIGGTLFHYLQPLDEDYWSGAVGLDDYDDYVEAFALDGGEGEITGYAPDEAIRGGFDSEVVELDDDEAGDVEISFDATRCEELERSTWD